MNPRLRKAIRILLRALAALAALLIIGTITLWGLRTRALTYLAREYLQQHGFTDPQLTVSDLQTDSLTVESVQLNRDDAALTIQRVDVSFSLSDLLENYRIGSAHIEEAKLSLELPQSSSDSTTDPSETITPSEILDLLDIPSLTPLPFERIQIANSTLTLKNNGASQSLSLNATARTTKPDTLALEGRISQDQDSLAFEATLSNPSHSEIATHLILAQPTARLDSLFPSWRMALPEFVTRELGPLDIQAELRSNRAESPIIEITVQTPHLAFDYEEASVALSDFSAKTSISNLSELEVDLAFRPRSVIRDTLEITPGQELAFTARIQDLSVIEIQSQVPINWSYDSETLLARSSIDLSYDTKNEESPISAQVRNLAFKTNDQDLAPFTLSATGNSSQIKFKTSTLKLADSSPASIENGSGLITIPDATAAPIEIAFTGTLLPAAIPLDGQEVSLPAAQLNLETSVFDESVSTEITLNALVGTPLFSSPEIGTASGEIIIDLDIEQTSDSELISGSARIDASNLSIQSSPLSGDGVSIQSKINFEDLDIDLISKLELSDAATLSALLRGSKSSIDWQANQLATPDFTAQWSGGSITLEPSENDLLLNSSFGAGILSLPQFRLEQVYLENKHQGTLAHLQGLSSLSAMLEGTTLQLESSHTIIEPLSDLSLSGEYKLSPVRFTHSDLPGRFVRELAGVTLSALVKASGTFTADPQASDATLSLQLSEGEIAYPASQINARGLELNLELVSLNSLDSGDFTSTLRIGDLEAGDLRSMSAQSQFRFQQGATIAVDSASLSLFGGKALLHSTQIPIDGSDFQGSLDLESFDLAEITQYIEIFDGRMQGKVSGYLPFQMKKGRFELLRGDLRLPDGSPASLSYKTAGLLTEEPDPAAKLTFSERLLKFLKIDPKLAAEQALGNITITRFETELFPENSPDTPIRIRFEGSAHSDIGDIPVVVVTEVHGSMSELYNFLIRLNSL